MTYIQHCNHGYVLFKSHDEIQCVLFTSDHIFNHSQGNVHYSLTFAIFIRKTSKIARKISPLRSAHVL